MIQKKTNQQTDLFFYLFEREIISSEISPDSFL